MSDILGGDPITVTSTEGLGSRLKSSCLGIVVGIILFFGSFGFLFWNEQRTVKRYQALDEGESQTIAISAVQINPENDGKLVHFTADVFNGGSSIIDSSFGVNCTVDCLSLQRHTSMYQWKETSSSTTKTNAGGSKTTETTYSYNKGWSESLINSGAFYDSSTKYTNPSSMRFPSETFTADPMMAGAYDLPNDIESYILRSNKEPINVSLNDITDQTLKTEAKIYYDSHADGFYFGTGTDSAPQIGDQKVWFTETPPTTITVVGVQKDNTVAAFVSQKDSSVLLYKVGNYTTNEMYDIAEGENKALAWIFRFLGFAMMTLGIVMIASPARVLADVVPCLGSVVGCGINFVAVTISAILSSFAIALAWLIFNPKRGGIILGAALGIIGVCAGVFYCLTKDRNAATDNEGKDENEDFGDVEDGKFSELPEATEVVPTVPERY